MYSGLAKFSVEYTVQADDELQAGDFIAEIAQEEFPDAELENIVAITEEK